MIIGISAKLGCGKTTLANIFLDIHPKYIKLAFADLLKQETANTYNYPEEWNYSEEGKNQIINHNDLPRNNMTVREALQWHGTDFRRKQNPDYWLNSMKKTIDNLNNLDYLDPPYIMIDDVRFKNEAKFINNHNGILIRLNPYPKWTLGKFATHKSEIDLDDYKYFDLVLNPEYGKLRLCIPLIEKLL